VSDDYELSLRERLAVWLTVRAPELRMPYSLAEELLEPDGPLGEELANVGRIGRIEALLPNIGELAAFERDAGRDAVPLLLVRDHLRHILDDDA
jgi:hypothetical protein